MKGHKKKLFVLGSIMVGFIPAITLSCTKENDNNDNWNTDNYPDYTPPNKPLDSSQLQEIKNSFIFKLTEAGKKLRDEKGTQGIVDLIKEIKKTHDPKENGLDRGSILLSTIFEKCINDERFKVHFIYKGPSDKDYAYLKGHKIDIELETHNSQTNLPGLLYEIKCPDRPKFGVEGSGFITLEDIEA
ncbi:hypothetical protein OF363_01030 [Mycoplasma enhydrae]|uniref:hypothetical protein n=1 Tax=Mycoplasma enhydrae TaxID=2499220 RepID=UPI0021E91824|nr:hypothetical protein [Mycoplasma enhydrae]MCV3733618.1 hypothetical protein [Mycoplasma enhydrae]